MKKYALTPSENSRKFESVIRREYTNRILYGMVGIPNDGGAIEYTERQESLLRQFEAELGVSFADPQPFDGVLVFSELWSYELWSLLNSYILEALAERLLKYGQMNRRQWSSAANHLERGLRALQKIQPQHAHRNQLLNEMTEQLESSIQSARDQAASLDALLADYLADSSRPVLAKHTKPTLRAAVAALGKTIDTIAGFGEVHAVIMLQSVDALSGYCPDTEPENLVARFETMLTRVATIDGESG